MCVIRQACCFIVIVGRYKRNDTFYDGRPRNKLTVTEWSKGDVASSRPDRYTPFLMNRLIADKRYKFLIPNTRFASAEDLIWLRA